ncbi:hypothetical protein BC940DRAFT_332260 [Gongronella butleri]|nr:hypothetical protein BC940DRAFT_332260 [Gongronella butleri]
MASDALPRRRSTVPTLIPSSNHTIHTLTSVTDLAYKRRDAYKNGFSASVVFFSIIFTNLAPLLSSMQLIKSLFCVALAYLIVSPIAAAPAAPQDKEQAEQQAKPEIYYPPPPYPVPYPPPCPWMPSPYPGIGYPHR